MQNTAIEEYKKNSIKFIAAVNNSHIPEHEKQEIIRVLPSVYEITPRRAKYWTKKINEMASWLLGWNHIAYNRSNSQ